MKHDSWVRVARFLNLDLDTDQYSRLAHYRSWLAEEAVPSGAIGPSEVTRLESRHIADSMLFVAGFDVVPERIRDLGSGAGLPGIPLAIVLPETELELVDRSGRRVDLMRRAVRVLGLENVSVLQGDITDPAGPVDALVSRASLPPDEMRTVACAQLKSGGTVVVGGSWLQKPTHEGWTTTEIPTEVLDQTVWLLIMRRQ